MGGEIYQVVLMAWQCLCSSLECRWFKNASVWISNGDIHFNLPKWILNAYEKFKIYVAFIVFFLYSFSSIMQKKQGEGKQACKYEIDFYSKFFLGAPKWKIIFSSIHLKYYCLFYQLLNIRFLFSFQQIQNRFFCSFIAV